MDNDRQDLLTSTPLPESKPSWYDSHPPTSVRTARLRARPGAAPTWAPDEAPAVVLLADPEAALTALEDHMFASAEMTRGSWTEAQHSGQLLRRRAIAATLANAVATRDRELPTVGLVVDLIAAGHLTDVVASLIRGTPAPDQLRELTEDLVSAVLEVALVDAGVARYALDWAVPRQLADLDGRPVDLSGFVTAVCDDSTLAGELRDWLVASGVSLGQRLDPGYRTLGMIGSREPELLAAVAPLAGRYGVLIVLNTGLVLRRPTFPDRLPILRQGALARALRGGVMGLFADPNVVYLPYDQVVAATMTMDPRRFRLTCVDSTGRRHVAKLGSGGTIHGEAHVVIGTHLHGRITLR